MEPKTIWMHYLIIGISIVLLFNACDSHTDITLINVDLIYRNETNHSINYYEYVEETKQKRFLFQLDANSERIIEFRNIESHIEQIINNYCQTILSDYQGNNSILIDYDNNDKCIVYNSKQGSATGSESNYESRTISQKYYEFKYIFSEEEYNKAGNCN